MAQGGADPVSAIANAAGEFFTTVRAGLGTFFETPAERLAYQQWLVDTFPEYKWFFQYERRKDNTWILVAILGVVAIAVIIGLVWKKTKEE